MLALILELIDLLSNLNIKTFTMVRPSGFTIFQFLNYNILHTHNWLLTLNFYIFSSCLNLYNIDVYTITFFSLY